MSMFLLPPGPDLIHQSLQLDDIHLSWGRGRGGVGMSGETVII